MERLTTNNPKGNLETLLNFAFDENKKVMLRICEKESESIDLCEYTAKQCCERGCEITASEIIDNDAVMFCDDCPIAVLYTLAVQAAELRARLKEYEDTSLTPTEVAEYAKAKADGRAVILPDIPYNKTLYWIWGDEIMPVYYRGIRGGCAHNGKYHVTCDMVTKKDRTFSHKDKEFTYKAGDERCFYADDIGKTVFFTREDAEKALKEREQNG